MNQPSHIDPATCDTRTLYNIEIEGTHKVVGWRGVPDAPSPWLTESYGEYGYIRAADDDVTVLGPVVPEPSRAEYLRKADDIIRGLGYLSTDRIKSLTYAADTLDRKAKRDALVEGIREAWKSADCDDDISSATVAVDFMLAQREAER